MTVERFDSESTMGYTQISTFYEDFSIAEHFGVSAIKDTYKRAFKEWKTDYKMLTELVMVLNWKLWRWYQQNDTLTELYDELYRQCDDYAYSHLKGDELSYFIRTID